MKSRSVVFLAITAIAASVLACTINIGGPAIPEQTIPVSTEAVAALETQVQAAFEAGMQTGIVILEITEEQLTSVLAYRLQEQATPLIYEPQVYLRDGQIQIYGLARQGYLEASVGIIVTAVPGADGQPQIDITSVDFGPLPVPEGLNNAIAALVREAFTGSLGPVATGFRLEAIAIQNGVMTVGGRVK